MHAASKFLVGLAFLATETTLCIQSLDAFCIDCGASRDVLCCSVAFAHFERLMLSEGEAVYPLNQDSEQSGVLLTKTKIKNKTKEHRLFCLRKKSIQPTEPYSNV